MLGRRANRDGKSRDSLNGARTYVVIDREYTTTYVRAPFKES